MSLRSKHQKSMYSKLNTRTILNQAEKLEWNLTQVRNIKEKLKSDIPGKNQNIQENVIKLKISKWIGLIPKLQIIKGDVTQFKSITEICNPSQSTRR